MKDADYIRITAKPIPNVTAPGTLKNAQFRVCYTPGIFINMLSLQ